LSSPIPGFEPCTPNETLDYSYLQIGGGEQSQVITDALDAAMQRGICTYLRGPLIHPETSQFYHRIKTTTPNVGDRFALPGDFIVIGTNQAGEIVSVELCKGPDSTNVENRAFADHFTINGQGS
jgi:hypothetical protein